MPSADTLASRGFSLTRPSGIATCIATDLRARLGLGPLICISGTGVRSAAALEASASGMAARSGLRAGAGAGTAAEAEAAGGARALASLAIGSSDVAAPSSRVVAAGSEAEPAVHSADSHSAGPAWWITACSGGTALAFSAASPAAAAAAASTRSTACSARAAWDSHARVAASIASVAPATASSAADAAASDAREAASMAAAAAVAASAACSRASSTARRSDASTRLASAPLSTSWGGAASLEDGDGTLESTVGLHAGVRGDEGAAELLTSTSVGVWCSTEVVAAAVDGEAGSRRGGKLDGEEGSVPPRFVQRAGMARAWGTKGTLKYARCGKLKCTGLQPRAHRVAASVPAWRAPRRAVLG